MNIIDDFFQSKKRRNLFFVVIALIWLLVRLDREVYDDTLISNGLIIGIRIGVIILSLLVLSCFSYIREFFKKLSITYRIGFAVVALLCCYLSGDFFTYCFLKINQPSKDAATMMVQCPVLFVQTTDSPYSPGKNAICVGTEFRNEKKLFWFTELERKKDVCEAKYVNLTIGEGRLGYDYIMRKDFLK